MIEDRVWQAILNGLVGRPQRQVGEWTTICCPMCISQGTTPDKRFRCGVTYSVGHVGVNCFNCKFKTSFEMGHHLGTKMKEFLLAIGTGEREVSKLTFWAQQLQRQIRAENPNVIPEQGMPRFAKAELPEGARSLQEWDQAGCDDPHYRMTVNYLLSRGDTAFTAATYYWTPNTRNQLHHRLIIPCYQNKRLVGWIGRAVDGLQPRYHKELPSSFLFNSDCLRRARHYVFIVEGVFDALVLDAVGVLGGSLNDQQTAWINQSRCQPILVPDRDVAGTHLIEIAKQQNWAVAFPHYQRHHWWDADIKDADDAVRRFNKLYVVQSILATQERDPRKIDLRVTRSLG